MIKIISDKVIHLKIENEIEKLIVPFLIEPKDLVEMKIVRNVFSKKEGKKIDRIECFAKIRVEKVSLDKMRIIGKIEEASNERIQKGYHGENIEEGKELLINKEKINERINFLIKRIDKIKIVKNIDLNDVILKNQKKFVSGLEKVKEFIDYGIIKDLFICKSDFFNFFELILETLEKNGNVLIVEDKNFCEKIKIATLLRFDIY